METKNSGTHHVSAKGILGRKLGMTQVWDDENRIVPVTVIEAGPCRVVQLKTRQRRNGYSAVQLAFGDTKPQGRLIQDELGHLKKADAGALHAICSSCGSTTSVTSRSARSIGADVFGAGERVDVTGISKGKGFTGAMQRRNFKVKSASRTVATRSTTLTQFDRRLCATPARVFQGMKMAGQYGNGRITTQNLEVVEDDAEGAGILLVKGAVPGPNGGLVVMQARPSARSCSPATAGGAE